MLSYNPFAALNIPIQNAVPSTEELATAKRAATRNLVRSGHLTDDALVKINNSFDFLNGRRAPARWTAVVTWARSFATMQ